MKAKLITGTSQRVRLVPRHTSLFLHARSLVLDSLKALGGNLLEKLLPREARKQPTLIDELKGGMTRSLLGVPPLEIQGGSLLPRMIG